LRRSAARAACAALALGCETPRLLVHVATDAPLPPAAASVERPATGWLFDTMLVEVRDGTGKTVKSGDFPIDTGTFSDGGFLSFAVVPNGPGWTIRLRLARRDRLRDGEARASASLETWVRAPVPETSLQELYVVLSIGDVGLSRGDRAGPMDASFARPPPPDPWLPARVPPCPGAPPPGEVCVPGGAFWLGDPVLLGSLPLDEVNDERLVAVSPFYMDSHEVTVKEFREKWPELENAGLAAPPRWSEAASGGNQNDWSTFTTGQSSRDQLPVNGVPWATAQAYCRLLDKDLPTESMWEWVASGLGQEYAYPWGDEDPSCLDSVLERAGAGLLPNFPGSCRPAGSIGGPAPVGTTARDSVALGGGAIFDLGGNLTEWTREAWRPRGTASAGLVVDPDNRVDNLEAPGSITVKGGSWRGAIAEARAGARGQVVAGEVNRSIGFRCTRSAVPSDRL
jgi:formylglycine-generating enzyme